MVRLLNFWCSQVTFSILIGNVFFTCNNIVCIFVFVHSLKRFKPTLVVLILETYSKCSCVQSLVFWLQMGLLMGLLLCIDTQRCKVKDRIWKHDHIKNNWTQSECASPLPSLPDILSELLEQLSGSLDLPEQPLHCPDRALHHCWLSLHISQPDARALTTHTNS